MARESTNGGLQSEGMGVEVAGSAGIRSIWAASPSIVRRWPSAGRGPGPLVQLGVAEGDILRGLGAQERVGWRLPLLHRAPPEDVSEGSRILPKLASTSAGGGVGGFFHGSWRIHRTAGSCPFLGNATEKSTALPCRIRCHGLNQAGGSHKRLSQAVRSAAQGEGSIKLPAAVSAEGLAASRSVV